MPMAVILVLIVAGSVAFHFINPWWTTPLASNWKSMDDMLKVTLVFTGLFFIGINLFLAYVLLRFRHRAGHRAAHGPESRSLERWLIGVTAVGIMALLAPGLVAYANYVKIPPGALVLEVLGQQWQWRFRFPGADGRLGATDARFVQAGNPFGIDPADPAGQDDLLVMQGQVHLPLGQPVEVLARANDVLHDFYVPPFRARMNIVPGQVSRFWFTPTLAGRYEALCAQLCGVGHPNMRGEVLVEDAVAFEAWRRSLPTFAATQATGKDAAPSGASEGAGQSLAARGRMLADAKGCAACHAVDGSVRVGPTWKGLYGKTETLDDGSTVLVDEAYLRGFIRDPQARSVKGFPPVMPRIELSDAELDALVAYIRSLAEAPSAQR